MKAGLRAETCLAVLREKQNDDGGWGYHYESQSRVEPTCWALSALSAAHNSSDDSLAISRAQRYLLASQQKEGFWTASQEMKTGNWVTSLACAVLSLQGETQRAALAGLAWLCQDYPMDSSPWMRFLRRLRSNANTSLHDDFYRGWGWTPQTSSWVEPTAFALLAMQQFSAEQLPVVASRRRELAVGLLYDRMCPGGGWNCGNPRVYGVDGEPLVLPTSWALMALHMFPEHENKSLSLSWLKAEAPKIQSPASLAVATMCLQAYGKELPAGRLNLEDCAREELLCDGVHVLAWTSLALNARRAWPARIGGTA
jgi:Squalene-hopene cyclase C-terminal domain